MEVKVKGIYKHYKGDIYLVEDIAIHSDTEEELVLYRALYGDCTLYAKPYDLFLEKLDKERYPNAEQEYRFEPINIKTVRNDEKK